MNFKLGLMGAMLVGGTAVAADGIKLGGFVNPTYTWTKSDGADGNTFTINDGALYLGKTLGTGEVMLDMPLATGNNPLDTGSNDILAGFNKAQAYVQWKYENGFMWKLGQFDSLYGVEANDSADRFFSEVGIIKGGVQPPAAVVAAAAAVGATVGAVGGLPTTHTGLVLGYDFSDALAIHLLVSNPFNRGTMTAGNPNVGIKLATNMDGMRAGVAFLANSPAANGATGNVGDMEWLVDVTAGTQMDMLTADLEATIFKGEGSGAVTGTSDETGFGIGLHVAYGATEDIKIGLRGEYVKIDQVKAFDLAVGPKFAMSKDMEVGLEYFMDNTDIGVGDSETGHAIALSAIHRF